MIGNSVDESNFPRRLFLTNRQVENLRIPFSNNLSVTITLSKTQLSKIVQTGGFLDKPLRPLLGTGLPLMKNGIKPLAKSVLNPLGLTATVSVADAGIHKKP